MTHCSVSIKVRVRFTYEVKRREKVKVIKREEKRSPGKKDLPEMESKRVKPQMYYKLQTENKEVESF